MARGIRCIISELFYLFFYSMVMLEFGIMFRNCNDLEVIKYFFSKSVYISAENCIIFYSSVKKKIFSSATVKLYLKSCTTGKNYIK